MRLIRLVALFGSLMLLTATVVLFIERRIDVQDDQDGRVRGAADAALVSVDAVLSDVSGAVDRSIDVLPPEPAATDLARSAGVLARVVDDASACIGSSFATSCTADDLFGLSITGSLLTTTDAADGAVVVAADEATDRLVIARRALTVDAPEGADPITAVVAIPTSALISESAGRAATDLAAETLVAIAGTSEGSIRLGPERIDGSVVITDQVADRFAIGSIDVLTTVDGTVGFFSESTGIFVLLIGLGSVLLVLAAGTFLADRRRLVASAATDDLTGLANRREFERIAAEAVELAERFNTGLTVMVVDLNGFKQINDTLGHQFGDLVLKGTADRLDSAVRATDTVGRWGGDEFVIVLPGLDEATAIRASADRITAKLSSSPVVGDTIMGASIGAAAFPRHGADFDTLLCTADAAMYAAKSTGVPYHVADADLYRRANGLQDDEVSNEMIVGSSYIGPDRRSLVRDGDGAVDDTDPGTTPDPLPSPEPPTPGEPDESGAMLPITMPPTGERVDPSDDLDWADVGGSEPVDPSR